MRKKILIALDSSIQSHHAMDYALQLAERVKEIDFVLINIQPIISQYLLEDALKSPKSKKELEEVYENNKIKSQHLLEECKKRMTLKGIHSDCIEIKTHPRVDSISGDLLNTASVGSYDAILVGRRGISGLQELLMGSVTSSLLAKADTTPVWVVDGTVESKKIVIVVDGSPCSLRAVDHVSFMLAEVPNITLEFLNIQPRLADVCEIDDLSIETTELEKSMVLSNEKCIADFSGIARDILIKAGFSADQIIFRSEKINMFTAKAIIDVIKKENFGTVVIGKTGAGQSTHIGRITRHVIQKITNRALWVVP